MDRTPADRAYELVNGFRASQLVRLAAELRVPDRLADGPLSADELGRATDMNPGRLRRVLRGLAALGVVEEVDDGCFKNTEVGELFREGVDGSQRARAMMLLPESYRAWDYLMETMRSGRTGHEIAHGGTLWDSLARDADFAARFNQAMASGSEQISDFVANAWEFSNVSIIVDVGGGNGALAAGILRAHPHLRGIISDLPAGLAETQHYVAQKGVSERCSVVESNFFDDVPNGGDVYLLKDILHDWDDDHASQILKTCRRACHPGARILLIERVLPTRVTETPEHLNATMTDLQMMVQLGSRERTLGEYRGLLEEAGFGIGSWIPGPLYGIVEGIA